MHREGQRELVMHTLASHPKWVSLLCRGPNLTTRSVLGGCAADRSSVPLLHPQQPTSAWNHDNYHHAVQGDEACVHYLVEGAGYRKQTNTTRHALWESVCVDFFFFKYNFCRCSSLSCPVHMMDHFKVLDSVVRAFVSHTCNCYVTCSRAECHLTVNALFL